MNELQKQQVLGLGINAGPFATQVQGIIDLARERRSSYVCCVNAHMTVEAHRDRSFAHVVNGADLATPDGMPVLFAQRWFHRSLQERVAGNDLMPALFHAAAETQVPVFLYGGAPETLSRIEARARSRHPGLRLAGSYAPPFRPLAPEERRAVIAMIADSGAGLVMVSLGCPKQERWMADMKGSVHAVMVGLGGAFRLYAGIDARAPRWMRDMGLEWTYRLALEPARLWKRYLVTNSWFLYLLIVSMLRGRGAKRG
jgi:N-acetylglucosaminyldiphosphoundecaprenol N-acetyl-beta-D-mannosaminyltransferase